MVHTRTAIDEAFGKSLSRTITSNADLPLNYGPGGARFLVISASAGLSVRLPQATYLRKGAAAYTIYNSGSNPFTVTDWAGTSIWSVLPSRIVDFHLLSNSSVAGSWIPESSIASAGTPLAIGRVPMSIKVASSQSGLNLRTLADRYGYTGEYPLALTVEIAAGINIDSNYFVNLETETRSLDTGVFYAGTTVMLINRGTIQGKGGSGGLGAQAIFGGTAYPGTPGRPAIYARHNLTLVNFGLIAGGGGGGGGGGSNVGANKGGGGGGGGQGFPPGGGNSGFDGGQSGGLGLNFGGIGGAGGSAGGGAGGNGGPWGTAGSAGITPAGGTAGGAGGAAGHSLLSAGGGPVITKLVAGLLYGPEVLS